MNLRSGAVVGGELKPLPTAARPVFEEGVRQIFKRWTALGLAVENEWGGHTSKQKAENLYQDVVGWFYHKKEHYVDELEEALDTAIMEEFNVEAEDDSPHDVAQALVRIYHECTASNFASIQHMMASEASGAKKSQREVRDRDGTVMDEEDDSSSSASDADDMDDTGGPRPTKQAGGDAEMNDAVPQAVPLQIPLPAVVARPAPPQPVVDADGFTLVQSSGRRGRRS